MNREDVGTSSLFILFLLGKQWRAGGKGDLQEAKTGSFL